MNSTLTQEDMRTDEIVARLKEQLSRLEHDDARPSSDPQTQANTSHLAVSGDRPALGGWTLRTTGFLLAAFIGVAAMIWWLSSSSEATKTVLPQPAPLETGTTAAGLLVESTQLRQSIARDLATAAQAVEQLKASQEQITRENTKIIEQLEASQAQMLGVIVQISEQLKASREQMAGDNANVTEQLKANQEQLARILAQVSEQKPLPTALAPPPRLIAAPTRRPVPTARQVTGPPKPEKPKLSSTSRQPATPAR
jgi:hypothetical protein